MKNNLNNLVADIERLVAKATTEHPGPSLISIAPSLESTHDQYAVPEAVLFSCIFVALKRNPQFVEGVQEILQSRCPFGITHGHASAFAAIVADVKAGAEAQELKLELIIYPDGTIWSYNSGATIVWRQGHWYGLAPRFEKAKGPAQAHQLSRKGYDAMPHSK